MSLPSPLGAVVPWYVDHQKIFIESIIAFIVILLAIVAIFKQPTAMLVVCVAMLFIAYSGFMTMVMVRSTRYLRRWHAYEASVVARAKTYEALFGQDETRQGRQVAAIFHLSNGQVIKQYAAPFYDLSYGDTVAYRRRVIRGAVEIADLEIHRTQPAH